MNGQLLFMYLHTTCQPVNNDSNKAYLKQSLFGAMCILNLMDTVVCYINDGQLTSVWRNVI